MCALAYFPIGLGWAYMRWFLKIKDVTRYLIEQKDEFLKSQLRNVRVAWVQDNYTNPTSMFPPSFADIKRLSDAELGKYFDSANSEVEKEIAQKVDDLWIAHVKKSTLRAKDFREPIINWITWWPFSMFWVVVDDGIHWCGRQIYNLVGGSFQKMSDSQFKGI